MIYLYLFLEFFKIGLFTFGGGYAMIPLIKEVVLTRGWMSESEFLNMIGLSEVTPGPIAINMATYVGSTQGGQYMGAFGSFLGSATATIAVILPAIIIMLIVSLILKRFMKNRFVQGALSGIRPVAIALILSSGIILLSDVLFPISTTNGFSVTLNRMTIFIFLLIAFIYFVATKLFKKKISAIKLILIGACLGIVVNYINLLA